MVTRRYHVIYSSSAMFETAARLGVRPIRPTGKARTCLEGSEGSYILSMKLAAGCPDVLSTGLQDIGTSANSSSFGALSQILVLWPMTTPVHVGEALQGLPHHWPAET